LATFKPVQAQELCRQLVAADRDSNGSALHAFRFYVDTFEPNNEDQIALAVELPEDDLQELYTDEISQFIDQEFSVEPSKYEAWNHLDTLASHTIIEEVYASDISLSASSDRSKIEFTASLQVSVSLFYGGDKSGNASSFPGSATGHISAQGMFLDEVTVDTDSFYE